MALTYDKTRLAKSRHTAYLCKVVVEAGMTSPTAHDALPSAGSAGGSVSSQTEDCCVPRFYFDVQRDAVSEPDLIGTELTSDALVP